MLKLEDDMQEMAESVDTSSQLLLSHIVGFCLQTTTLFLQCGCSTLLVYGQRQYPNKAVIDVIHIICAIYVSSGGGAIDRVVINVTITISWFDHILRKFIYGNQVVMLRLRLQYNACRLVIVDCWDSLTSFIIYDVLLPFYHTIIMPTQITPSHHPTIAFRFTVITHN